MAPEIKFGWVLVALMFFIGVPFSFVAGWPGFVFNMVLLAGVILNAILFINKQGRDK